jgi:hypothetical protein
MAFVISIIRKKYNFILYLVDFKFEGVIKCQRKYLEENY